VPFGDALSHLYREADIFVLPSFHEGLPYVILEAMAQSLPIISTTVGGLPYTIANGMEGILLPPGRPNLLADAIEQLSRNPEDALRMGRAAFRKAREFRSDEIAWSHRRLIEEAFGQIEGTSSLPEFSDARAGT
jgi:glycosyltransferase involved in cell wall biosynthesis